MFQIHPFLLEFKNKAYEYLKFIISPQVGQVKSSNYRLFLPIFLRVNLLFSTLQHKDIIQRFEICYENQEIDQIERNIIKLFDSEIQNDYNYRKLVEEYATVNIKLAADKDKTNAKKELQKLCEFYNKIINNSSSNNINKFELQKVYIKKIYYIISLNICFDRKLFEKDFHNKLVFIFFICFKNLLYEIKNSKTNVENLIDVQNDLYYLKEILQSDELKLDLPQYNKVGESFSIHSSNDILDSLISNEELIFCNLILKHIDKYYSFNKIANNKAKEEDKDNKSNSENSEIRRIVLISDINIEYTLNFIDYVGIQIEKGNNFEIYKKNLMNFEKILLSNYNEFGINLKKALESEKPYSKLYPKQIEAYGRFLSIFKMVNNDFENIAEVFPFGSVIQFLGANYTDLDICIYSKDYTPVPTTFIKRIFHEIRSNKNSKIDDIVINQRIIKISYKDKVDVDINFLSICGVMNSLLIRTYVFIDERFIILCYILKKIFTIVQNEIDKTQRFNNYSLDLTLITYLQDIENPPILPKILTEDINRYKKDKFQLIYLKQVSIPREKTGKNKIFENLNDKNYKDCKYWIYHKYNDEIEKEMINSFKSENKKPVSLILVEFLEYLIYIYRPKSMFIDAKNEKFDSKVNYNKNNIRTNQKGVGTFIIIKDPFDHYYNPCKIQDSDYDKILTNNLKNMLECIKNGENLDQYFTNENDKKNKTKSK